MKGRSQHSSFLPDFCGVRMLFVIVLISELLAIMITLALSANIQIFINNLAIYSLLILWISLCCTATLCIFRHYLNNLPDFWAATLSYLFVLMVAWLVSEAAWLIVIQWPKIFNLTLPPHAVYIIKCLGISAIVSALMLRYFYVQHQWRFNIQSEARSRVQALTSRIRPHFLFNCMNTIASLTRKNPLLAEEAIEDLADLFRASLKETRSLARIDEELEICRRYIRIETHRLGNRLKVDWNIEQIPQDALIPFLSIQPLLENAIYHGIETLPEGGEINIHIFSNGNRITVSLDNPVLANNNNNDHEGNRIAHEILQQRLTACFGNKGRFRNYVKDNRYFAEITLPYTNENTDR